MLKIKGYDIKEPIIRDSFQRRAQKMKNDIIEILGLLGVEPHQIEIDIDTMPIKKAPASVEWYFNGHRLHYSHNSLPKFIENLFIVSKIIELETTRLLIKEISVEEFCQDFTEDEDVMKQRVEAREILGLDPNESDPDVIDRKYKLLAKQYHPDMPGGDHEMFKKINRAHKTLKKEIT